MEDSGARIPSVAAWVMVAWVVAGLVVASLWSLEWGSPPDTDVLSRGNPPTPFVPFGPWRVHVGPWFVFWRATFLAGASVAVLLSTWMLARRGLKVALLALGATVLLTLSLFGIGVSWYSWEVFRGYLPRPLLAAMTVAPTVAWALVAAIVEARLGQWRIGLLAAGGAVLLLVAVILLTLWATSCQRPWSWRPHVYILACNLTGRDLSGRDLSGANLGYANLSEANLQGANLTGARLEGAILWGANLTGTNLEKADLTQALYDEATRLPKGLDPVDRGMRFVDTGKPEAQ